MISCTQTALLCLVLVIAVQAARPQDEVKALPGWDGSLSSRQYSGYLDIPGGKHLHYWLVESEASPSSDPLVLWFNGGPGCSSLDGYFYEQGPYHVVEPVTNASGAPMLYENPYRWNKVANMLFLEAPAAVGFSYADTPAGRNSNDTQQAVDNYAALLAFYEAYPEYAGNDLYITGESYAGMYVPTLALEILSHNDERDRTIPLKGIAVGNGVTGRGAFSDTIHNEIYINFYRGHGLFSAKLETEIRTACGDFINQTDACKAALDEMHNMIGPVNVYDIYLPCINSGSLSLAHNARRPLTAEERERTAGPAGCIDAGAASAYLNTPAVRKAIHVRSAAEIGPWVICSNTLNYTVTRSSLLPDYKNTLIPNIGVLIYNGDVSLCSYPGRDVGDGLIRGWCGNELHSVQGVLTQPT